MKTSGKTLGAPPIVLFLCSLTAFVFLISSVAATLALSDVSFTPNLPMVPAQPQQVSAKIWINPSGATTFASGHEIQLQTTLANAQWNIQVIVDGIPAARQTAQGNAAFINGALLAYSTDRDVSIVVNIFGTVPANAGSSLMVMQIQELDNNGSVVPGSVITISQPTTVSAVTPLIPTIPVVTPIKTTPPPTTSQTRAPGFSLLVGIGALCIVTVVTTGYYSRKYARKKR